MKNSNLTLSNLMAVPGERSAQELPVRLAGVEIKVPVVLINGTEPGPTFCVTAAIHGAEYPCVEAAKRLALTLDPERLRGQVIVVPIVNPVAFRARSIYVTPLDGKNLNRQFPGKEQGTFSEALAYWLFNQVIACSQPMRLAISTSMDCFSGEFPNCSSRSSTSWMPRTIYPWTAAGSS